VINERLTEFGIILPSVAPPVGNYVGFVIVIAVEIEMTSRVRD
jgi:hypothetical protein